MNPDSDKFCQWIRLGLILAVLTAYSNSLASPFVFDDLSGISGNPHVKSPGWGLLGSPEPRAAAEGRPLVGLSFALNHALGGLEVSGYHAANLAIHLGAVLVLFGMLRRTSGEPWTAGAIALLWAVHPLQTASVTYLSQRAESLMGLLYLSALYGLAAGRPRLALLASALGMAAKEVMATAPLALLLYDRCFLSGSFREAWRARRPFYLALASTWLILAACLAGGTRFKWGGFLSFSPWEYAGSQPGVLLHYLRLCFWPHPLVLDYAWAPARGAREILPQAAVLLLLLGASLWLLRRRPALGFPAAAFFLVLAPTSLMPQKDLAFEHRMYLPLAAVITLAVLGLKAALPRSPAAGLVLAAALCLGLRTRMRNEDYASPVRLWSLTAAQRPQNARAHTNLGVLLGPAEPGRALAHLARAAALAPGDPVVMNNLANGYARLGELALAIQNAREAARLAPGNPVIRRNLEILLEADPTP